MKKLVVLSSICFLTVGSAYALSSDRQNPISIAADKFFGDEVKQIATYSGNVIVKQGSIEFKGNVLSLSVTPKGYRHIELTGSPASFKQKRDSKQGSNEWMHASANRLIYDEENDKLSLLGNAKLSRTENGVQKDSTSGENITYDMRNARSVVTGGVINGQQQRVTTIIAPRSNRNKDASNDKPSLDLSTASNLTPVTAPSKQ